MKKAFSLLVAVVALLVPAAAQATVSADVPVGDPIVGTNGAPVSLVVGVAEPIVLTAVALPAPRLVTRGVTPTLALPDMVV